MKKKRFLGIGLGAALAASSLTVPVYASGEANLWIQIDSTNISGLGDYCPLRLSLDLMSDDEDGLLRAVLYYAQTSLLEGNLFLDSDSGNLYASVPELTDTVFSLNLEETLEYLADSVTLEAALGDSEEMEHMDEVLSILEEVDYEALAERYLDACGDEISALTDNMTFSSVSDQYYEYNGESVLCSGAGMVFEKETLVNLATGTADFLVEDEECRGILESIGEMEVTNEDIAAFHENVSEIFEESLSDVTICVYCTPDYDIAAVTADTAPMDGRFELSFEYTDRGGEIAGENVEAAFYIKDVDAGETMSAIFSREVTREEGEVANDISFLIQTGEADGSLDLNLSTSYVEASGEYGVSFRLGAGGEELLTVDADGTVTQEGETLDFTCDHFTWQAEGNTMTLSAALQTGELTSVLQFEGDTSDTLNLLTASSEELEEEGEIMTSSLETVVLKLLLAQAEQ
ncbi:MAG: hypothetical protein LUG62_10620 [Clostridiales bacterium]|nr:hypothetical protein [Clostridiales bacterium]